MTRYIYSAIILICFALLTLFSRHEFVCNMLDMCGEDSEDLTNKQANPNDVERTKSLFFVANGDTALKGFDEFYFAEMGAKPLLNANNNTFLNKILDYLNQNPTANLVIKGYYWESEKGVTSGILDDLGLARADVIRGWLKLRNIDENRLRIKSEMDNNALSHPLSFMAIEKTIGVPTQYDNIETMPNYTFRDMTYNFAYDSDVFTPNAAFVSYADSVKTFLRKPENAKLQILIVGHTDNIDNDAYNIKLGKGRAENAKAYFVKKAGISASKITTESQGESTPITTNETEEGRQRNRRVNIQIID